MSGGAGRAPRAARRGEPAAWLVGGAVRDRLLGRATDDVDLVVDGDVRGRRRARRSRAPPAAPAFELSDAFGAWRVIGPDRAWQVDLTPLQGGSLEADLALRDFTVNAIAEPLDGGELVDPHGGAADLEARRLRMVAPRRLRRRPAARRCASRGFACELGFDLDRADDRARRARARPRSAERRGRARLRRAQAASSPAPAAVARARAARRRSALTEARAARAGGAARRRAERATTTSTCTATRSRCCRRRSSSSAIPSRSLGDELAERGGAAPRRAAGRRAHPRRRAALRRAAARRRQAADTRRARPAARVGFPGHDALGADLARDVLGRLRASASGCARTSPALTRHHLRARLPRPPARRWTAAHVHAYLARLRAGRGRRHAALGRRPPGHPRAQGRRGDRARTSSWPRELLAAALDWREQPARRRRCVRGDELAAELGIAPRARARRAAGRARGGRVRGRDRHARGGASPTRGGRWRPVRQRAGARASATRRSRAPRRARRRRGRGPCVRRRTR